MQITINTNDNKKAVELLDFYRASISPEDGWIRVVYENVDQIPSICRLLVAANIDIRHISVIC